ncbi:GNAT family N-acetyltransferase [Klebsiella quasipneumoniae]|uniref:GNAT family N-acetyltransferase n=1 Tax=Klebsiella quasipneumoniae TaxID=1463165 RepID=UPI0011B5D1E4|nr:GNAT family N-acetyltransferase [Klebsiella quasipneumoniae]TWV32288.1 GNAT family N-acetyltransferase [Klebsiella quasipneumoniae subsp. similipneumoniae]HBY9387996.1 GNAT family N-acetyltransferase [Klebsiella pneumoniae]
MELYSRIASADDAGDIARLVNSAYRPSKKFGWTHESDLISGDRISVEQVRSLFHENSVVLLLCDEVCIVSCVHIKMDHSSAYIGMLATNPELQSQGLGKKILSYAEQYAIEFFKTDTFRMSVLSSRPELLAFYERRGYTLTGETNSYPLSEGVGKPKVTNVQVLSLIKVI